MSIKSNGTETKKQTYYISTAIPYVNAKPHLGFALEAVLTDTLARYQRQQGADVHFQTGSDENSLKNVQAAQKEGVSTQMLVERNAAAFFGLRETLNLSFDDFIRTSSEPRHRSGVQKLWQACAQTGDIYKRTYEGLYCVGCEQFYSENEMIAGLCPEHHIKPEIIAEENYFFRLSRYADQLEALIASDRLRIVPTFRKNEVLRFIRDGLHDFSISRAQARAPGWGISVPGDPEQVIYVWFDALGNYITALDYMNEGADYHRYWADNPCRVHVIGKGVTRFHAIYWPAMLLSAGVPLPTTIFIHGYLTLDGDKISKSLGNVIDPVALTDRYGVEALRYYLLAEVKATEDGDFTLARFIQAYNANLADQLGNLLSRTIGMVERYYAGVVPAPAGYGGQDRGLPQIAETLPRRIDEALHRFAPHEALTALWELISAANKYVAEVQPWHLAKVRDEDPVAANQLATTLYNLVEVLRLVSYHLTPFLPTTAASITQQIGLDAVGLDDDGGTGCHWGGYPAGTLLQPQGILFPKLASPEGDVIR